MSSISKTDRCTERSILAVLSAYQAVKLMTSQMEQRARPLITILDLNHQRLMID